MTCIRGASRYICCTVFIVVIFSGCAELELSKFTNRFNTMIGQHKDDLVLDMGVPKDCIPFRSGEACEWIQRGGTDSGPISGDEGIGIIKNTEAIHFFFSDKQIACEWRYDGFYGVQRSTESCNNEVSP